MRTRLEITFSCRPAGLWKPPDISIWLYIIPEPYQFMENHPPFSHERNPIWGKSVLLGGFITSGGDY